MTLEPFWPNDCRHEASEYIGTTALVPWQVCIRTGPQGEYTTPFYGLDVWLNEDTKHTIWCGDKIMSYYWHNRKCYGPVMEVIKAWDARGRITPSQYLAGIQARGSVGKGETV